MNSTKSRLSKTVLEMKFMKRTKEKVEIEEFQEDGEAYFENKLTAKMKSATGRFIIEPSFVFCEQLIEGRVSYNGMNPEIEKLMELERNKKAVPEKKEEADVSEEQMAKLYKRNHGKSRMIFRKTKFYHNNIDEDEPRRKKSKFLKPID
ncbi:M-phase phosphoprotein 6 [Prorops nasuta]|uniref:M-phase phosphoprotein 6 n=1 Tax=Prorops nasuta TaxID=863751 RepID=UPI0034CE513C